MRLADWADDLERGGLAEPVTIHGKKGVTTLVPWLPGEMAGLVSIAADAKSVYMQFWRSVFERRAPPSIPAVESGSVQN